jgi:hypothetical protein
MSEADILELLNAVRDRRQLDVIRKLSTDNAKMLLGAGDWSRPRAGQIWHSINTPRLDISPLVTVTNRYRSRRTTFVQVKGFGSSSRVAHKLTDFLKHYTPLIIFHEVIRYGCSAVLRHIYDNKLQPMNVSNRVPDQNAFHCAAQAPNFEIMLNILMGRVVPEGAFPGAFQALDKNRRTPLLVLLDRLLDFHQAQKDGDYQNFLNRVCTFLDPKRHYGYIMLRASFMPGAPSYTQQLYLDFIGILGRRTANTPYDSGRLVALLEPYFVSLSHNANTHLKF